MNCSTLKLTICGWKCADDGSTLHHITQTLPVPCTSNFPNQSPNDNISKTRPHYRKHRSIGAIHLAFLSLAPQWITVPRLTSELHFQARRSISTESPRVQICPENPFATRSHSRNMDALWAIRWIKIEEKIHVPIGFSCSSFHIKYLYYDILGISEQNFVCFCLCQQLVF